ncbi:MAG: thymidylate synthase, partial [Acidobacteria bacterium]|nr:thymidylate synthase [Acidobacteriota bacterium]
PLQEHFRARHPQAATDSDAVYRAVIRAKALDTLRGLLPAATRSNVGIYGSGQAYEMLLLRMRSHSLVETREVADLMLRELRRVIPAFLQRVDRPDRGVRWSGYLEACERETRALTEELTGVGAGRSRDEVVLTEFDPEGEIKVVAAALYAASALPLDRLLTVARGMTTEERIRVLRTYAGDRENRRHRPGRAFEHASYTFDVLSDYGAFRDLQRHRMLTLEWQHLTTRHGRVPPPDAVEEVGALGDWRRVMDDSAALYERLASRCSPAVKQYAVSMAYRVRYYMRMNAREAMHVVELRTTPQGHPTYRRVCQRMHRLIAERAGHRAIADAMKFADHSSVELERLASERTIARKRAAQPGAP